MMLTDEKIRFIKRLTEVERKYDLLLSENKLLKFKLEKLRNDTEFNERHNAISRYSD